MNVGNMSEVYSRQKNLFPKWPFADSEELMQLTEVLENGAWWRITGKKVSQFEEKFSQYLGSKYCLCVASGTIALELVLESMGIGEGDEVILPANSFISTATAVTRRNAVAVFVDINRDTYCIDSTQILNAITKKTKAIIIVHMAGFACDMAKILKIAKENKLYLIEDAAHAHGGEYDGKKLGTFGDAAIFSFQNGKLLTCGEGGAIVTDSKVLFDKAFLLHAIGREETDKCYKHQMIATTARMSEFQGAVLLAQIKRLEKQNEVREKNALKLGKKLSEVDGIVIQKRLSKLNRVPYYMFMFSFNPAEFGMLSRNEFVELLNSEGVPAFISFPVISQTAAYANSSFYRSQDNLQNCSYFAENIVWLPHHLLLGDESHIDMIVGAIKKIQSQYSKRIE